MAQGSFRNINRATVSKFYYKDKHPEMEGPIRICNPILIVKVFRKYKCKIQLNYNQALTASQDSFYICVWGGVEGG